MDQMPYFDKKISNLSPINVGEYYAFIPNSFKKRIKNEIKAVFVKNSLRLKSIDRVYQKYFVELSDFINNEKEKDFFGLLLNEITDTIDNILSETVTCLQSLDFKDGTSVSLGVSTTMTRLTNSYEASLFLIKNQFFFESMAINRLIFEQLNYCFNVSFIENFKENNEEQIKKELSPTNISKLKKSFPDLEIGRLYSYLTKLAHIDTKKIHNYLSYDEVISDYLVTFKSLDQSIESAIALLKIIDLHSIVFEYTLKDFITNDLKSIISVNGKWKTNNKRELPKLIKDFQQKFSQLREEHPIKNTYIKSPPTKMDDDLPF